MDHTSRSAIETAYDTVADSYAQLVNDTSFEAALDLKMIDHFVGLLPGPRILDAGCGPGRMMTHLKSIDGGLDVDGVDLSAAMVERARAAHPAQRIVQGDLSRLPHPDSVFHGVLAWYSIIHTAPECLHRQIAELTRVLMPGGSVLIAFQSGAGARRIDNAYGHPVSMTAFLHSTDHVTAVMCDAGLDPVARLDRAPRDMDKHPQGFVIGTRVGW